MYRNYLFILDRSPLLVTFAICIHVSMCVEMSSLNLWFTFSLLMGLLFIELVTFYFLFKKSLPILGIVF